MILKKFCEFVPLRILFRSLKVFKKLCLYYLPYTLRLTQLASQILRFPGLRMLLTSGNPVQ